MNVDYQFASDTTAPAHPKVLETLSSAIACYPSYGNDEISERVRAFMKHLFERDCQTLFLPSGTGSNTLALGCLLDRHHSALIADTGHMLVDEHMTVASNLGNQLIPVPSLDGKVTRKALSKVVLKPDLQRPLPGLLSISQPTEYGVVYSPQELQDISVWCRANGIKLHIDGARLANAIAHLKMSPDDLFRDVAMDALSFGFSKNGGLIGDALVIFGDSCATEEARNRNTRLQLQFMQLPAKSWAIALSIEALLKDDVWLENALNANRMAHDLGEAIQERGIVSVPVETNAVFFKIKPNNLERFRNRYQCYNWHGDNEARLMTSWRTTEEDVTQLLAYL